MHYIISYLPTTYIYSRYPSETVSLGASRNSFETDDDPPPYYDIHDLPPLGTCTALYAFDGKKI